VNIKLEIIFVTFRTVPQSTGQHDLFRKRF
jgi:hypothetical protein